MVPTIARELGVRQAGRQAPFTDLKRAVVDQDLLLVLDNFEHLLPAAVDVARLLRTCGRLKVRATSREPLHLHWEHEVPVLPLALPDAHQPRTLSAVAQSPAVALFVARAQACRPDFVLVDENAGAVAELCTRLDGLPLAIELAAGWVHALDPASLLARLERQPSLLATTAQDAPTRHRTLRTAMTWSFDLLSEGEQSLFCRLGVFSGGWSLAAAEAVAHLPNTLVSAGPIG